MKILITPYSTILLFVYANIIFAQQTPPAILDTSGDEVQAEKQYTVEPLNDYTSALVLESLPKPMCPPSVILRERSWPDSPVTFHPVNCEEGAIRESTPVYMKFMKGSSSCGASMSFVTKLDNNPDPGSGLYFLVGGGSIGEERSQLKIEKLYGGYRFVSCALVECKNVTDCHEYGAIRFCLLDHEEYGPKAFQFRKYKYSTASAAAQIK